MKDYTNKPTPAAIEIHKAMVACVPMITRGAPDNPPVHVIEFQCLARMTVFELADLGMRLREANERIDQLQREVNWLRDSRTESPDNR